MFVSYASTSEVVVTSLCNRDVDFEAITLRAGEAHDAVPALHVCHKRSHTHSALTEELSDKALSPTWFECYTASEVSTGCLRHRLTLFTNLCARGLSNSAGLKASVYHSEHGLHQSNKRPELSYWRTLIKSYRSFLLALHYSRFEHRLFSITCLVCSHAVCLYILYIRTSYSPNSSWMSLVSEWR